MKRCANISLIVFVLLTIYFLTFSCWWGQSRRYTKTVGGKQVQYLEFHYNAVSWHTRLLWAPALWLAEHLHGYHEVGFAAAYEDSVILYAK